MRPPRSLLLSLLTAGCASAPLPSSDGPAGAGTSTPANEDIRPSASPGDVERRCSTDGWCWDGAASQGNDLLGVWAASPRDVWAVGDHGTVLHFDGARWSSVPFPTQEDLIAVTGIRGASGQRVWVGGRDGMVHAWDGRAFRRLPLQENIGSVRTLAARGDELWIGVEIGLFHDGGDGKAPSRVDISKFARRGVSALAVAPDGSVVVASEAPTHVAFQQDFQGPALVRVRARGGAFDVSAVAPPPGAQTAFRDLLFLADGALMAVEESWSRGWVQRAGGWEERSVRGGAGPMGGFAMSADGSSWIAVDGLYRLEDQRRVAGATKRMRDVTSAESSVFAVGERGAIAWWDGTTGHDAGASQPGSAADLARDVVSGAVHLLEQRGGLQRRTERGFEPVIASAAGDRHAFEGLACAGGACFAIRQRVRDDGFSPAHAEIVSATNGGWSAVSDLPSVHLTDIDAASAGAIWAVGVEDPGATATARTPRAVAMRFDGAQFRAVPTRFSGLVAVAAVSAEQAWVLGADGLALLDARGGSKPVKLPREVMPPVAIAASAPDDVWIVGREAVAHVVAGVATLMTLPAHRQHRRSLLAAASRSPSDVTVVGEAEILHFDGRTWRMEDAGAAESMSSVVYLADGSTLAASARGAVIAHSAR